VVPVDENHVHQELVWKADVHQGNCGNVKNNTDSEDQPAQTTEEHSDGKEQLPDENKAHRIRQVFPDLRQPERAPESGVVQVIERMKDREGRQIVRA